ncbi:hypothetical protein AVEN_136519-1 [Araneus ventricosus]|uniref:Uncharacterized protein n=1 Tax=Araneus ventricosus TaxID=182803 RepID=A0A4Y2KM79_ARAVE|nr:hypothetical protein AVEN_136519-1 [Araneus ventricosus]
MRTIKHLSLVFGADYRIRGSSSTNTISHYSENWCSSFKMAKTSPLSGGERSCSHPVKGQETNPPCIFRGDRNMCQEENVTHDCDRNVVPDTSTTILINGALKITNIWQLFLI